MRASPGLAFCALESVSREASESPGPELHRPQHGDQERAPRGVVAGEDRVQDLPGAGGVAAVHLQVRLGRQQVRVAAQAESLLDVVHRLEPRRVALAVLGVAERVDVGEVSVAGDAVLVLVQDLGGLLRRQLVRRVGVLVDLLADLLEQLVDGLDPFLVRPAQDHPAGQRQHQHRRQPQSAQQHPAVRAPVRTLAGRELEGVRPVLLGERLGVGDVARAAGGHGRGEGDVLGLLGLVHPSAGPARPRGHGGCVGAGERAARWPAGRRELHAVLLDQLPNLRIVRGGLDRAAQRRLGRLAIPEPELQNGRETVGGDERREGGQHAAELLQRLAVLSLFRVDAREEDLGCGIVGVCLHALLADDHRLHEAAGGEVCLGQRPVRFGRGIRGEGVLEGELGGGERLSGRGHREHNSTRPSQTALDTTPREPLRKRPLQSADPGL